MLDRQTTKEKIMQLITRCTQLINVQHNMNAMQIEFCAEQILDKMYYYSLEDIQLCLDRGAIGEYGPIYNRIDPATIPAADKLSIKEAPKVEAQRIKASPMEQMMMDEYDALPLWNDDMRFRVYNNRPYQFTEYRIERYRELIENQNEY